MEFDPQIKIAQRLANQEKLIVPEVNIIAVTDLGPGNAGAIGAADIPELRKTEVVQAVARPEYRRKPTNRFRCIDGRVPEGGLQLTEGFADPQTAGGEAITSAASDMMLYDDQPVSLLVKQNVVNIIGEGRPVVVHGDDNKGAGGCGAAGQLASGEVFKANVRNKAVVAPKAWTVGGLVGLHDHLKEAEVSELINRGGHNAKNKALFDVPVEGIIEIATEHGAEYEELIEDHSEKVVVVDASDSAFDEGAFMRDFQGPDGQPVEAFVASIKLYKDAVFESFEQQGRTETEAARKVMGAILFNLGVGKQLTAEEQGGGEALPVVIVQ